MSVLISHGLVQITYGNVCVGMKYVNKMLIGRGVGGGRGGSGGEGGTSSGKTAAGWPGGGLISQTFGGGLISQAFGGGLFSQAFGGGLISQAFGAARCTPKWKSDWPD